MPEETKMIYMLLIGDWSALNRAHKRWGAEQIKEVSEQFIAKYSTEEVWYKRLIRDTIEANRLKNRV